MSPPSSEVYQWPERNKTKEVISNIVCYLFNATYSMLSVSMQQSMLSNSKKLKLKTNLGDFMAVKIID